MFTNKILNICHKFSVDIARMPQKTKYSINYFKLNSIFDLLVKSEINNAYKHQMTLEELLKRDAGKPLSTLNNINLSKNRIVNFWVSFSKDKGKILNFKNNLMSSFFGYENEEFQ